MKIYRVTGFCMACLVSALVAMDQRSGSPASEQPTPQGWVLEGPDISPLHLSSPSLPLLDHQSCNVESSSSSSYQPNIDTSRATVLPQPSAQSTTATTFFGSLFSWMSWNKQSEAVQSTPSQIEQATPLTPSLDIFLPTEKKQLPKEESKHMVTLSWAQRVGITEKRHETPTDLVLLAAATLQRAESIPATSPERTDLITTSQSTNSLQPSKSKARRTRRKLQKSFSQNQPE